MNIRERLLFLGLPNVLALANLALYYGLVMPILTEGTRPTDAHFWVYYGDTGHVQVLAGSALLVGALVVGSGNRGYSLRPWKPEVATVEEALSALSGEPMVLVQSGLFPHAGYEGRTLLLTHETLRGPRNAGSVLLLAPQVGAYPFSKTELAPLLALPPVRPLPAGLVAVRSRP